MVTLTSFLNRLLDLTQYSSDKSEFISNFKTEVTKQAYTELAKTLSRQQEAELLQSLEQVKSVSEAQQYLLHYFSQNQIQQMYMQQVVLLFSGYLQSVAPTLTESEKDTVAEYLQSIEKTKIEID